MKFRVFLVVDFSKEQNQRLYQSVILEHEGSSQWHWFKCPPLGITQRLHYDGESNQLRLLDGGTDNEKASDFVVYWLVKSKTRYEHVDIQIRHGKLGANTTKRAETSSLVTKDVQDRYPILPLPSKESMIFKCLELLMQAALSKVFELLLKLKKMEKPNLKQGTSYKAKDKCNVENQRGMLNPQQAIVVSNL